MFYTMKYIDLMHFLKRFILCLSILKSPSVAATFSSGAGNDEKFTLDELPGDNAPEGTAVHHNQAALSKKPL